MGSRIIGVGITGTELTDLEREILRDTPPYAVVLFGRNVSSAEQLKDLVADCKAQSDPPPLILIDQEGGRVDRLRNLIPGYPAAESFLTNEATREMTEWFGRVTGDALRWFDIEVDLAPVVDILRHPPTRGLERRCFGEDAETVVELAGGFVRGLHNAGVASCLKHFPGISLGSGDPHYGMTQVDITLDDLMNEDLRPYRELGNLARAVMIGHATYPQIDEPYLPASLSKKITIEILRDHLGFEGIAFSDDMEMHAVSDLGTYEEITDRSLLAGNDVILFCSHIERVPDLMDHVEERARNEADFAPRVREALRRSEEFRAHCARLRETHPSQMSSFDDVKESVAEFVAAFEKAGGEVGHVVSLPPSGGDRRTYPRDRSVDRRKKPRKGTGRSGREEWT